MMIKMVEAQKLSFFSDLCNVTSACAWNAVHSIFLYEFRTLRCICHVNQKKNKSKKIRKRQTKKTYVYKKYNINITAREYLSDSIIRYYYPQIFGRSFVRTFDHIRNLSVFRVFSTISNHFKRIFSTDLSCQAKFLVFTGKKFFFILILNIFSYSPCLRRTDTQRKPFRSTWKSEKQNKKNCQHQNFYLQKSGI